MVISMASRIERLWELTSWRAFDVDDAGRVLAGCDESGSTQLVELEPDGSVRTLTALPGAVSGRYLPGERQVVVEHDSDGDEHHQLSLLDLDTGRAPAALEDLRPLVRDPRSVHRLLDVLPGRVVYATNRRNGVDFDVVIHSAVTGEEQVVYDRGGLILGVAVSPDSRYLVVTLPGALPMSDRLLLVNTMPATEHEHVLVLTDGTEHAKYTHIAWLPDDSGLVVTTNSGRDYSGVAHLDPRTGALRWLVRSEEHEVTGWLSPDGTTLLVHTNDDGASRFALHDAATGQRQHTIDLPEDSWSGFPLPTPRWSPDSRSVTLTISSPVIPCDVVYVQAQDGSAWVRTDSAAPLRDEPLALPTAHRVPTPDGERIPCFVYPASPASGSAVLLLHGGPENQSVRAFNPVVQALTARGHTVLVPNVRGSTGYGKRWYSADDVRRRLDAVADLAVLHDWLPSLGLDPDRAALWGGSYGGYLVLAGLVFQPERWAAGVDIVGISALRTFLENTAGYRRAHREREYGSLTDDADFLHEASPLTHVDALAAPLFVIHGANDPRVPLSEARQIVAAARAKDIECELLVYDDEGHGLTKRANRRDAYPKAIAFLDRHLE